MNKLISFIKTLIVIAVIVLTSGYSLANVFAQEYSSAVSTDDSTTVTEVSASEVATVDSEVANAIPGTPIPVATIDEEITPATVDGMTNIAPVDEETPNTNPDSGNNGGGRNSSGGRSRGAGQVLGAENFQFTTNLSYGMQNNDVMELQKRLRAEGFFFYPSNTGYFGPFTLLAVKLYQYTHYSDIGYITGFVGPLTRAVLNAF